MARLLWIEFCRFCVWTENSGQTGLEIEQREQSGIESVAIESALEISLN